MSQNLFESRDSVRHSRPLRYVQSANLDQPLELELGGQLAGVTVAYETYGQLNAARDIRGMNQIERSSEDKTRGQTGLHAQPLLMKVVRQAEGVVLMKPVADDDQRSREAT